MYLKTSDQIFGAGVTVKYQKVTHTSVLPADIEALSF